MQDHDADYFLYPFKTHSSILFQFPRDINNMPIDQSVVALKAALLGTVFLSSILLAFKYNQVVVPSIYVACLSFFHLSEFFTTYFYNLTTVETDSFILGDTDLHLAHGFSLMEYTVRRYFVSYSTSFKLGLLIAIIGQFFRLAAMCTAAESFHHYVQKEQANTHKLVTHGVYSVSRHPLYFGFWWWFVGLELWLGNPIALVLGGYKLWKFFLLRIEYEEQFLVKFFGDDYEKYRAQVRVWIPFVN